MKRSRTGFPAVLAALLLAGCAGSTAPADTAGSPAPTATSSAPTATSSAPTATSPAPTAGTSAPPATPPTATSRGTGKLLTVTGTVKAGVENGCLILSTPQGLYTLLGNGKTTLRAGAKVEVQGRTDETRVTTCQQGKPFLVSRARVLD